MSWPDHSAATLTGQLTSSDLTGFKERREPDTNDAYLGIGYHIWTP